MNKIINKKAILIASLSLLLCVSVGVTLALIFTQTSSVENTFNPSNVSCAVVENGNDPVSGSIVETGTTKTNVQIKNTGDTDAYIRVAVVVNWVNKDGTKVWATKPVADTDYTITYALTDGWFLGSDGYYYYNKPVSSVDGGNLTSILISEAKLKDGVPPPTGTDGTQYYLSIEIVASAIQASPNDVVEAQWDVMVANDGTISKQGG